MLLLYALCLLMLIDGDLIRQALRHADISLSKAAIWMEMDVRQLDRQLHGEGHLKHTALLKLPLRFHQWLSVLQVARYGLPKEVRRALPLAIATMGQKRMLRMERAERKERTA